MDKRNDQESCICMKKYIVVRMVNYKRNRNCWLNAIERIMSYNTKELTDRSQPGKKIQSGHLSQQYDLPSVD